MNNKDKMLTGIAFLVFSTVLMFIYAFIGNVGLAVAYGFSAVLIALYIHDFREIQGIEKHKLKDFQAENT